MPKHIIVQLRSTLLKNEKLCGAQGYLKKDTAEIHLNVYAPIGNRFPQLNINWNDTASESVIPAERGFITIDVCLQKDTPERYKMLTTIMKEVENTINKRPQKLTDLTEAAVEAGTQIRTVHLIRTNTTNEYEMEKAIWCMTSTYEVVKDDQFAEYDNNYTEWNSEV